MKAKYLFLDLETTGLDPFPSSGDGIHRAADDVTGSIAKARELFARIRA